MNSAQTVESAIASVMKPGGLRAMTLFSEWGTGKTYLVQEFFKTATAKAELESAKLTYAYVSLFGAESLAEVRRRLSVAVLRTAKHPILRRVSFVRKILPGSTSIHGVDVDLSLIGSLASDYIQDTVFRNLFVCIDDLERAEKLSAQDLLGLIAEMTEQRGCKCLLIFNGNKLSKEHSHALLVHEENVFDLSLEYQPSVADNLLHSIANPLDRQHAARVFESFKNANIRIMKRVAWVLRVLRENGAENALLWPLIVEHAAVLTVLKHAHGDKLPNLSEALEGTSEVSRLFGEKDNGKFPGEIRTHLDDLQFEAAPFDPIIIRLLETGSLLKSNLDAAMKDTRERAEKKNAQATLHAFWDELRAGFGIDQARFTSRLKAFIGESKLGLSSAEFIQICDLLLEIDPSPENKTLVVEKLAPIFLHTQVVHRKASLDKFPAILSAKVDEAMPYELKPVGRKLSDVLNEIVGSDTNWDPKGYVDLVKFKDAEIRDYFLTLHGDRVIFQGRRLFERIPTQDQEAATIFSDIAARNPLNRFQVEFFVRPTPTRVEYHSR